MRILVVSHPPLTAELGSSQTALALAAALSARGHDALAWSPEPLPPGTSWRNLWRRQARAIERFAAERGPFDLIDTPAVTASRDLARQGRLVVRSIQPELHYLLFELRSSLRRPSVAALANALVAGPRGAAILAGWRRASVIVCLGSRERHWMSRHFPAWASKLRSYVSAPLPEERPALLAVRRQREATPRGEGVRFLWIGRWAAHKGTRRLLRWIAERPVASCDTVTLAGCGSAAERDMPPAWLRSGRVRIVPSFSRAELPEILAAHDVGLFTSTIEGWGLTLNEMLEAGMPVYATEAGAVDDLRPFFPESLRPFPPPARIEPSAGKEELETNGYFVRFNWESIACSYEEAVLTS